MGLPLGATSTRRANIRVTSTRNPAAGVRMTMEEFEAMKRAEAPAKAPAWRRPVVWAVAAVVLVAPGFGMWKLRAGTGGSGAIPAGPTRRTSPCSTSRTRARSRISATSPTA